MFVVLDLETTGLDCDKDEIIEIAIVKFNENTGEEISRFCSLIKPKNEVPELISNLTGITNKMLENESSFDDLKDDIQNFIGDCPILGHNIKFDIKFLIYNGVEISNNLYLDTFFLANFLCRNEQSLNLSFLVTKFFGKQEEEFHRALADTLATKDLFFFFVDKIKNLSTLEKEILSFILWKSVDKNLDFLRKFLGLDKIKAIGYEIVENYLSKLDEFQYNELIFSEETNDYGAENLFDNEFLRKINGFEPRENQNEMGKLVWNNLFNGGRALLEAPTGVGKTYAYLIPAIKYSTSKGVKVIISTKTKNLQDQLFFKDARKLSEIGLNFSYTKLKGKSNYLGLYPFFQIFLDEEQFLNWDETNLFIKIAFWLLETKYGELDELNFYPQEYYFVKTMNADNYFVPSDKNPYREKEFLFRARKNAQKSNIVIVNHSLLLQDIKSSILGGFDDVIIDEAHNLEDSATDALKINANYFEADEIFGEIGKNLEKAKEKVKEFYQKRDEILFCLRELFEHLSSYLSTKIPLFGEQKYSMILLKEDFYEFNSENYRNNVDFLSTKIKELSTIFDELSEKTKLSIMRLHDRLKDILDIFETSASSDKKENYIMVCFFSEKSGINIFYTLLNPGQFLKENFWDKMNSCLLTSATLKIGDNFDYIDKILSTTEFERHSLKTDFDYSKQALLYTPTDLGSIKWNDKLITEFLEKFLLIVRGQTLILLTSFTKIKEFYVALNPVLKQNGIILFSQGVGGGKTRLLSNFMESSSNSILMGTDSFWEGIDMPGEQLKYLVIHKFPFPVPTDPIFIARSKLFENSFEQYSIPKAILKLRQGFGRLIRNKNDKGIVILLDDRIHSTKWGNIFYSAFPSDIVIKKGLCDDFLEILSKKA